MTLRIDGALTGAATDDHDRVRRFWAEFGRLVARYQWDWSPDPLPRPEPRNGLVELPTEEEARPKRLNWRR